MSIFFYSVEIPGFLQTDLSFICSFERLSLALVAARFSSAGNRRNCYEILLYSMFCTLDGRVNYNQFLFGM